jgi:hypothetical protein
MTKLQRFFVLLGIAALVVYGSAFVPNKHWMSSTHFHSPPRANVFKQATTESVLDVERTSVELGFILLLTAGLVLASGPSRRTTT